MARLKYFWFVLFLFSCREAPQSLRTGSDGLREIYVVHSLAETVRVYQTEPPYHRGEFFITGAVPNHIYYYQDKLYVVNSGENRIEIMDESLFLSLGEIYLGPNRNPWMILASPHGTKALVPQFLSSSAAWIDLETSVLGEEISLGKAPEGGCFFNNRYFVACTGYQNGEFAMGEIWVMDSLSGNILEVIPCGPGSNPQSAVPIVEKGEVHVFLTGVNGGPGSDDGEILVIDGTTLEVKSRHFIGGSPIYGGMALDSSRSRVYLAGSGGVMSYNYQTMEILHGSQDYLYPPGDISGSLITSVHYDPGDDRLYLTDFSSDQLVILGGETGELLDQWEVDDGPVHVLLVEE